MTAVPPSAPRLLADIGGTNARFAWQPAPGAALEHLRDLPTGAHASLEVAIRLYLGDAGLPAPGQAAIAIATPITGDAVRMTNSSWSFSIEALRLALGLQRLRVLNDFTALAMALPALPPGDLVAVGGGPGVDGAAIALIGPGTGLGVSGLLPDGQGGWVPVQGEGGHATLAARTAREAAVIAVLEQRFGHVSGERAVSGQGLVDVHAALWALDRPGELPTPGTPSHIGDEAMAGQDARCVEAVELLFAFLGTMAGNLALTLGARGGVYIGGGIVPRLWPIFVRSAFRERFEGKGRFRAYLAPIPVRVIRSAHSPALLGAARALDA